LIMLGMLAFRRPEIVLKLADGYPKLNRGNHAAVWAFPQNALGR